MGACPTEHFERRTCWSDTFGTRQPALNIGVKIEVQVEIGAADARQR